MLSYKFRLHPTREQEAKLKDSLEINRVVYNYFVLNNFHNRNDMNYALTELKEQQPILQRYHSKMLQMVSTKVAGAWESMKTLKERGYDISDRLGVLKPEECNSFTYNQSGYKMEQLENGKCLLYLSKIGRIEIKVHRKPIDIKQITVVRQAGKWFAIVVCNILRRIQSSIKHEKTIGIDVGITNYVYDSEGGHVDNPKFMNHDLKRVRRSNKTLSRRIYGSKNYKKALKWHQRLHQRITNKRKNFLHNLSNQYSNRYDVIFLERLKINNMNKNHCLAKHIMDSSWGIFKQMLMYKANRVVEIEPYNTSVECSRCGNLVPKTLAIRIHECDRCGTVLDRDHNSACTIENRGMKLIGLPLRKLPMQHGEVTPVETLSRVAEAGIAHML